MGASSHARFTHRKGVGLHYRPIRAFTPRFLEEIHMGTHKKSLNRPPVAKDGLATRHAGGRVVSVLEGGYSLPGLTSAVAAHVRALIDA